MFSFYFFFFAQSQSYDTNKAPRKPPLIMLFMTDYIEYTARSFIVWMGMVGE